MKAIIISDAESLALLDSLELEALKIKGRHYNSTTEATEQAHRVFHFVVTRWLQSVGAETVKR